MIEASEIGPFVGVSGKADKTMQTGLLSVYSALLIALIFNLYVSPGEVRPEIV